MPHHDDDTGFGLLLIILGYAILFCLLAFIGMWLNG